MKRYKSATVVALTMIFGGVTAEASEQVGQWYATPLAAANWIDRDRVLDDGVTFQVILGKAVAQNWNVEGWIEGGSFDGVPDTDLTGVMVAGDRIWYRENRISPFLMIGTGLIETSPDGQESKTDIQLTYGLGFLIDLTRNGKAALRTEIRSRVVFSEPETFEDFIFGLGFQIPFGKPASN